LLTCSTSRRDSCRERSAHRCFPAIYLTGGIIGTLHHLYFAGTPTVALAFGSLFSALEIVPLLLEVMKQSRISLDLMWRRRASVKVPADAPAELA